MIFRPVTPESPSGPPMTKRPVALIQHFMSGARSSAGTTLSITSARMASRRVPVAERDRERHQLRRLVAGVTEHHALVPSALLPGLDAIDPHGDLGRLPFHGRDDGARSGVETHRAFGETDAIDRATHDR